MSSTSAIGSPAPLGTVSLGSSRGVEWTVEPTSELPPEWAGISPQPCPATVPGEVHVDLMNAGLIPDPFDGDNESLLAWIGRTDWIYQAAFDWVDSGHTRTDLVVEGLDTVARIVLNGREVARTENQHRSYRFDVSELLVAGHNQLQVAFAAPVIEADRRSAEIGDRPHQFRHPFNAIRKSAFSYGWDWGAELAGVGIWKPIRLESWSSVRLGDVRPLASFDGTSGILEVHAELEWLSSENQSGATVTAKVAGLEAAAEIKPGQSTAVLSVVVPDAQAWWPIGYGQQAHYAVAVDLAIDAQSIHGWQGRVGFRTVTLSTKPDDLGSEFVISVNQTPIFIKGAKWAPGDAFLTRLNRTTYESSILDAVDAGMNLLRVWGGGIYETDDFYDVCDELGVMVWQDFLLACATYAEEEPLWSEFEAEGRQAVARLAKHPSLVHWNGGNENIWGFVEWDWRVPLAGRTWGDGYYTGLFPTIVAELDPRTPYSAGSPFSYEKYIHPNDHRHGTVHVWDVWNFVDYSRYRDRTARFVSEMGFQGPPAWSTLTSVVHDEPMDPNGHQMLVHQKALEGNLKLERGIGDHLPMWSTEPQVDIDDWHWTTQLNQARAVTFGIAHFRSHYPLNRGAVVWSLNDNWPVISWAAVDAHGIRKPLWYALRAVYADRFMTIQPRAEQKMQRPILLLHNDSASSWSGEVTISRRTIGSEESLAQQSASFQLEPRAATAIVISDDVLSVVQPAQEYLVAEQASVAAAYWYFVEDTELNLASASDSAQVDVQLTQLGYAVHIAASSLIKDLALFPDRLDPGARVDTALMTLQAGESHTFQVTSNLELRSEEHTSELQSPDHL